MARRRREGFRFLGPFPTYTRRTRGGSRVSVGGCCLPAFTVIAMTGVGAGRLAFMAARTGVDRRG